MQTIARSMPDTGPMEGRYMPHAPPDCWPIPKAPAQPNATPPASDGARPNQFTTRALPITLCSTLRSLFARSRCRSASAPDFLAQHPAHDSLVVAPPRRGTPVMITSIPLESAEDVVDRRTRREDFGRQIPPRAAGPQKIEDRVHRRAHIGL